MSADGRHLEPVPERTRWRAQLSRLSVWGSVLANAAAVLSGCSVLETATRARKRRLVRQGIVVRRAQVDDAHFKYWSGGAGAQTVVFLHGFGGNALWQWSPQLEYFSRHYRVIAPDLLWFGESYSDDRTFSIQHQARAILALLDREGVDSFHLVGLSYGGLVAHEIVGKVPGRVGRVVLVASPARAFLADDKKEVLAEFGVDTPAELLLPRDADGVRRLLELAYHDPPWMPDFVARQVVSQFYEPHRTEHTALLSAVEANTAEHRRRYALPPDQPTLIVWGRSDRVFPERAARRLQVELGDRSQLCVFDKAAHAPHLERGREVTPLIHEFLAGTPTGCPRGSTRAGHDDA